MSFSGSLKGFAVDDGLPFGDPSRQGLFDIGFATGARLDRPGVVRQTLSGSKTIDGFPHLSAVDPGPDDIIYDGFIAEVVGQLEFYAKNDGGEVGSILTDSVAPGAPNTVVVPEPRSLGTWGVFSAIGLLFAGRVFRRLLP